MDADRPLGRIAPDALGLGDTPVVLASGSPRRLALLEQLGLSPLVVPADIDESPFVGEAPVPYVLRLAADKARAVLASVPAGAVVIAADTTVDLDGCILAKPDGPADARRMLRALSGRTHRVHTGVAVCRTPTGTVPGSDVDAIAGSAIGPIARPVTTVTTVVTTLVTMSAITDEVLDWYVGTGEPLDKAGAYALQGAGGVLVERVAGSVSNVVGLPLSALADLLRGLSAPSA